MIRDNIPMTNYDKASWNKTLSSCAGVIHRAFSAEAKKLIKSVKAPHGDKPERNDFADNIKRFMDNPMSPEDEAKGLRAMLHAGIATGEIPSNLLAVLEKTIGISSGEDDKVEVVDFGTAFKDLAEAIEICRKQKPEGKFDTSI